MKRHSGRGMLPDGVTPNPEIVKRYVDAYLTWNESALAYYESTIMTFIFPEFAVPVDEETFGSIMLPLMKPPGFSAVVGLGLLNPYCPVNVLTAACRGEHTEYRRLAATHSNCLEEDRVYAALKDGGR